MCGVRVLITAPKALSTECEYPHEVYDMAHATIGATYPNHAKEAVDEKNLSLPIGSSKKIEFLCPVCGTITLSRVANRITSWKRGSLGCGVCFRNHGTIEKEFPDRVEEVVDKHNLQLHIKSNKKILFICPKCGQTTMSAVRSRTRAWSKGNAGCNAAGCYRKGSIALVYPEHVADLLDKNHAVLSVRSRRTVEFRCCLCEAITASRIVNRTAAWDRGTTGCSCTGWGYDPLQAGWLYLVGNSDAGLLQVGITNNQSRRISEHVRSGFILLDIEEYSDGSIAKKREIEIKEFLTKALGHPLNERINGATFSGFTETWSESELKVSRLSELTSMIKEARIKSIGV